MTGSNYLSHFVCTKCCTSFKKDARIEKSTENQVLVSLCAVCKEPTYNCGRNFKAPKKEDRNQWEKVKLLISEGFWFQKVYEYSALTGGHHKVDYPEAARDVPEFVKRFDKDPLQQKLKRTYQDSID